MKSRFLRGLLLTFCCGHALFLLFSILPGPPGRDVPGPPALEFYRVALGGQQRWNMFETIPVLHSFDVRFERTDETGRKETAGAVLPGFKPYPIPEDARYYVAFYRLLFFTDKVPYRDAYLRKAADLLSRQPRAEWTLVVDPEYTRNLFHIKRDGKLSLQATKTFDLTQPTPP